MWSRLFDKTARNLVKIGTLHVVLPNAKEITFGNGDAPIQRIRLHDWATVRRIAAQPELALGEAYVDGTLTIENDDLYGLLELAIMNRARDPKPTLLEQPTRLARRLMRRVAQFNPVGTAQKNVAHHYDLSGQLYELFLDADRQYSCAYFRHPDDSLEEAQLQKKRHIARKLLIEPGMRVLDIGCGWGGMAITLAQEFGARVVGVTLSREQHAVATERVRQLGLENQVDIRLQDYRHVEETFDRIVSVGMFEHVGAPHFDEYFEHVHRMLDKDGVALIHTIGRSTPPGSTNPWIAKYIFPGGYCPAMSETMSAVEHQDLVAMDVEVWRLHYAETLKHWHDRFVARIDEARAIYDERFCRMWRFYLIGCELTFRYDHLAVFQFQLGKKLDAAPVTRDYLYPHNQTAEIRHAAE